MLLVQTKISKLNAVNAANQYSQDQVKLMGNADTDANPQYNIALSERRVQHGSIFS